MSASIRHIVFALARLLRLPNLLIVAITQYALYYALILPALDVYEIRPSLPEPQRSLLVLVTVLLTASGNIINDIIDFKIDLINRPDKVVINRYISIQSAYWLYFSALLIGFIIAFYLGLFVGNVVLVNIYPLAALLLFAYSYSFKKKVLTGNLLIAIFCAGVAAIIWFAERDAVAQLMLADARLGRQLTSVMSWYMVFAFLSTAYREIIKDMEDILGDVGRNCKTLPIVYGVATAKKTALFFGGGLWLFVLAMLGIERSLFSYLVLVVLCLLVLCPLAYSFYLLYTAKDKPQFHQLSQLAKLIMLGGLVILLLLALKI
jgi:4-hydroxybenzoate polyprenyltransferase